MKTEIFDYHLPEELIAQTPAKKRTTSRMLHFCRETNTLKHRTFDEICGLIRPDDVIVVNNTRVIPARVYGRKEGTGARIEVFFMEEYDGVWEIMSRPSRRLNPGTKVFFDNENYCEYKEKKDAGKWLIQIHGNLTAWEIMEKYGEIPLPPYIKNPGNYDRYQTVYAKEHGAVAAPTAGLHFSDTVIENLCRKGVQFCEVTLHVGYGTFKPVETDIITDHPMHTEKYVVSEETAQILNQAMSEKRRIIAVGTTVVRTLEDNFRNHRRITAGRFATDIFIYPGYEYFVVSALVTNFHLPRSTLIMLVSAFAGRDNIMRCYEEAIKERYRFYSFGDCMFIE